MNTKQYQYVDCSHCLSSNLTIIKGEKQCPICQHIGTLTPHKDPNVLLSVGDKYGWQVCDVKCYDAQERPCDCVCGGRNHGIGLKKALALTIEKKELYDKMYGKKLSYGEIVMKSIMNFG